MLLEISESIESGQTFILLCTKFKSGIQISWMDSEGMTYRYSDSPEYPRRGRYGDTTQRCAWCGKPTTYGDRICTGGMFRRNYCSLSCRAAGDYFPFLAMAILWPLFVFTILWLFQIDFRINLFAVIYAGILPTICLWCCVLLGRSERKGS